MRTPKLFSLRHLKDNGSRLMTLFKFKTLQLHSSKYCPIDSRLKDTKCLLLNLVAVRSNASDDTSRSRSARFHDWTLVVYCGTENKYFPSAISFSWRDD